MAFPSPEIDYVYALLSPESIMHSTQSSSIIPTNEEYIVAEPGLKVTKGEAVQFNLSSKLMFVDVGDEVFKTNDGIIEDDDLDDTKVFWVVIFVVDENSEENHETERVVVSLCVIRY